MRFYQNKLIKLSTLNLKIGNSDNGVISKTQIWKRQAFQNTHKSLYLWVFNCIRKEGLHLLPPIAPPRQVFYQNSLPLPTNPVFVQITKAGFYFVFHPLTKAHVWGIKNTKGVVSTYCVCHAVNTIFKSGGQ